VRYLKRWNDVAIPEERDDKPSGLAFTLLCCERLVPRSTLDNKPDDLGALRAVARGVADSFGRLVVRKPTPEYEDMFGRLDDAAMNDLKQRFGALADALFKASQEPDLVEACKIVQGVLGPDFPVPDPQDSAKKSSAPAIISSASSA
jgi:hypothetical protein